jgi:hypothetical protein
MDSSGVKNRYDELFAAEMDGWCYGIANYPGELYPALVHRVICELRVSFVGAVEHGFVFDLESVAHQLAQAGKYVVPADEIALAIAGQLPAPASHDQQFILNQIIRPLEHKKPDLWALLQRRWSARGQKRDGLVVSVFISHSSQDEAFGRWLATELGDRGIRVWIDLNELQTGDNLLTTFRAAINEVSAFVVVLSAAALRSPWVRAEIDFALNPPPGTAPLQMLPVLLEDCAVPEDVRLFKIEDFSRRELYPESFRKLLKALTGSEDYDRSKPSPPAVPDMQQQLEALVSRVPLPTGLEEPLAEERRGPVSDTRGWSDADFRVGLEALKRDHLGYPDLQGSGRRWWEAFEQANQHRLPLVYRVAEELQRRQATIAEFFLAYVYSNTDNIQANLHYLEYKRLANRERVRRQSPADGPPPAPH